jgi:serine/threonine protein kinase
MMLTGKYPFEITDECSPVEIYKLITNGSLHLPFFISDKSLKALLTQLLDRVPEKRLGGCYKHLKKQEFFKGIEWVIIE